MGAYIIPVRGGRVTFHWRQLDGEQSERFLFHFCSNCRYRKMVVEGGGVVRRGAVSSVPGTLCHAVKLGLGPLPPARGRSKETV